MTTYHNAGFESSLAFGLAGRHSLFSVGLLPPLKGHGSRYLIAQYKGGGREKKVLQMSAFATRDRDKSGQLNISKKSNRKSTNGETKTLKSGTGSLHLPAVKAPLVGAGEKIFST